MLPFIYLASSSPRRYELLTLLNIPFERLIPNVAEIKGPGEAPQDYVLRLAGDKAKAGAILAQRDSPVLGADTIVVLDDHILEKPADKDDAARMLQALSGRWHRVMTAIAVCDKAGAIITRCVVTDVQFSALSHREINDYISSGEPMDKAGAYGIQGLGGCFVRSINGSYHSVVGLPLVETKEIINQYVADKM
jgi:septum formation protein